jgi:PAS domain S-box-containing protein
MKDLFSQGYNFFRSNGRHRYSDFNISKLVVNLNTVWLATYLNLVICNIIILVFYPAAGYYYYISTAIIHVLYWITFLLIRNGYFHISRHIFLLLTYGMLISYDHFFGRSSLTSLYYIAFLPTSFKVFSLEKENFTAATYSVLSLLIMLVSNFYTYDMAKFPVQETDVVHSIRILNIVMAFMMGLTYTVYNVVLGAAIQAKLFNQGLNLQTTLNNAVGAIWSIDKNFRITAVNKSFIRFAEKEFGVKNLKIGVNIKKFIYSSLLSDRMKQHYKDVLDGKEVFDEITFHEKIYEIKAVPVLGPTGKQIGATFTSRDITHRKESEKELIEATKAAQEASLAKARFLSNMSHEIRTPLNGIVGITGILLDEEYLPSQHKNLQTLNHLSDHTLQLINNILDLAKIEAGKAEVASNRFNLQLFINKLNSIFENSAKLKKLDFIIAGNGNLDVYVKGDEVKLNQVLINLLGNAMKFTEKGFVKLMIDAATDEGDNNFFKIRFTVSDSGIGIRKEDQQKIFESFTQADSLTTRKFGGTGLGITISEKILQLLGSTLKVESEPGKGSSFWFDVKLAKSSVWPSSHPVARNADDYSLEGVKILMAEDNRINQMVAKRFLQKWKAIVTVAENGQEALDEVTRNEYDIVLMDLDMPVMDGYESTAAIKNLKPAMPIIALTAAAFDDMHNYLHKKGFSEVVQKPFLPDDLYTKISTLVEEV